MENKLETSSLAQIKQILKISDRFPKKKENSVIKTAANEM